MVKSIKVFVFVALIKNILILKKVKVRHHYILQTAVQKDNNNIVENLLKMTKVEVNCKDRDCSTPLHLALYYEFKEIVESLLKHDKIIIIKFNRLFFCHTNINVPLQTLLLNQF